MIFRLHNEAKSDWDQISNAIKINAASCIWGHMLVFERQNQQIHNKDGIAHQWQEIQKALENWIYILSKTIYPNYKTPFYKQLP